MRTKNTGWTNEHTLTFLDCVTVQYCNLSACRYVLRLTDTSHINSPGIYEYIRVARVGLSVHIGLVFRYVKLGNSHEILSKCLTQWTFHISMLFF